MAIPLRKSAVPWEPGDFQVSSVDVMSDQRRSGHRIWKRIEDNLVESDISRTWSGEKSYSNVLPSKLIVVLITAGGYLNWERLNACDKAHHIPCNSDISSKWKLAFFLYTHHGAHAYTLSSQPSSPTSLSKFQENSPCVKVKALRKRSLTHVSSIIYGVHFGMNIKILVQPLLMTPWQHHPSYNWKSPETSNDFNVWICL